MYANESNRRDVYDGVVSHIRLHAPLPTVFISDLEGATSEIQLRRNHIDVVVSVLCPDEPPILHVPGVEYHRFSVRDGEGDIVQIAEQVADLIDANPTRQFLIHCHAGMSRSASVVIYYVMRRFCMSYGRAKKLVKASRRIIRPSRHYAKQLQALNGTMCIEQESDTEVEREDE